MSRDITNYLKTLPPRGKLREARFFFFSTPTQLLAILAAHGLRLEDVAVFTRNGLGKVGSHVRCVGEVPRRTP